MLSVNVVKTTWDIEQGICGYVQQCQYDFDDLRSHLRQLRFCLFQQSNKHFIWGSLGTFELELLVQADRLSLDAKRYGCYVNCTTRWIAAGSSLQSFPADEKAIQHMFNRLISEYTKVRTSCKECAMRMIQHDLPDAAQEFDKAENLLFKQIASLGNASEMF